MGQPGYIDEKEKVRNRLRRIAGQVGGTAKVREERTGEMMEAFGRLLRGR